MGQQMKCTPLHAGSWKLKPVTTVNSVAIGSTMAGRNVRSGSRGTDGGISRSLKVSPGHGVVDSNQRAYSYPLSSRIPATSGQP